MFVKILDLAYIFIKKIIINFFPDILDFLGSDFIMIWNSATSILYSIFLYQEI